MTKYSPVELRKQELADQRRAIEQQAKVIAGLEAQVSHWEAAHAQATREAGTAQQRVSRLREVLLPFLAVPALAGTALAEMQRRAKEVLGEEE